MMKARPGPFTAFDGDRWLASGTLVIVVRAVRRAIERGASDDTILVFDDKTGWLIDTAIWMPGGEVDDAFVQPVEEGTPVAGASVEPERLAVREPAGKSRGRGRPKLGVVSREITLLPRHWEWLAAQPGGASLTLRNLVDGAMHGHAADEAPDRRLENGGV
ncbi:DUF2239 family protein [Paraburkholderia caballeronis]|uniref:DUF2239 family protein n=1 Tax=Paraburkholderia caballeronis TaxID=416943 RepID=UPI0010670E2D|nr:DUF2239 family protein [Paraburkholderia caballeronis]TDV06190.1 uncharacterized protein DUF2239 [Paraburkholderia caballeronis]TDV09692.1 uncharacterized protein DUF2239 [Paraburkholderia caballeronis]TDV32876.1 uncharacterized protein DUF2239 [Paraburkholderia caballeronis]